MAERFDTAIAELKQCLEDVNLHDFERALVLRAVAELCSALIAYQDAEVRQIIRKSFDKLTRPA